jgi:hypothetical protein
MKRKRWKKLLMMTVRVVVVVVLKLLFHCKKLLLQKLWNLLKYSQNL